MSRIVTIVASLLLLGLSPASGAFEDDFTGETLRIDYAHTGTAAEEHFALQRIVIEGPWPGSRSRMIDTLNLGKYLLEIADLATNRTLYTRGFASIYGEWETTGEARSGTWRAIEEAVRLPEPHRPFQVRIRKRGADQSFSEVWSFTVDPTSRFVDRPPAPAGDVMAVMENGPPAVKADIVILGDGYTARQREKFLSDVERLSADLFSVDPFASRKTDFNVRAVFTPSTHTGISRPRSGVFRDTPLGTRYNSFDSERYVLSMEDSAWRNAAAAAPYDFVLILFNDRKYGGGGIYGLYSTAAADSGFAPYLVIHEFGHHFAGLGDEYYTSSVAYEDFMGGHIEPWEPNITALNDPATLKWRDLVAEDTPLPTPWTKEEYEKSSLASQEKRRGLRAAGAAERELEQLFEDERTLFTRMLSEQEHAGKVGAFEGAMYEMNGLYRPTTDCIMFTRDEVGFCPVCSRAIERVIDMYSR